MPTGNRLTIPIAIVAAGLLIAGALYYTTRGTATPPIGGDGGEQVLVRELQADDHVLGSPNARIVFVEYSDFECPFCKNFHNSMHQIIDEYGPTGEVAWVYRQFPLAQLHSKAPKEAEATECAAELGGNDGFWAYADKLFEVTPSNNGLDLDQLPVIAEDVGLDRKTFEECLDSGRMKERVDEDVSEAFAAGANGTPHNVIIVDGQQVALEGAQPYASIKSVIESILSATGHIGVPDVTQ